MAGSTRDVTYALRINTEDAKGKIPEVTGEAKASLEGLSSSTVKSGEDFQSWGAKVQEAAAGTGTMEVSVTELATALATGKINLAQFKDALGPIKTAEDEAALALGRFTDAMVKLGASEENPRRLGRAVVQAQVSVESLARSLQAVGKPIPPEMEASIKRAQVEIDRLNTKAGIYRDVTGDMAVKQKLAAQGMETMAARGGSLQGILGGLADSSGAFGSGLAKVGLATFGVIEAFKLGYEGGQKLRELWQSLTGSEMPNLTNWFVKLWTGVENANSAFDHHGVVARSVIGIHHAHEQALAGLNAQMAKLFPSWNKEAEELKKVAQGGDLLNKILKEMSADHQDLSKFGKENADVIISIVGPALAKGTLSYSSMSAELRVAVRAALDHVNALGKESDSLTATINKLNETAQAHRKATLEKITAKDAAIAAYQDETSALYKKEAEQIKALNAMTLSEEEYNKRKKAIHEETTRAVDEAIKKEAEAAEERDKILRESRKNEEELRKATAAATEAATDQAKATDAANTALKGTDAAFDEVTISAFSSTAQLGKAGEAIQKLKDDAQELIDKMKSLGDQFDRVAEKARQLNTDIGDPTGIPM